MKWGEVNHTHHRRRAIVELPSSHPGFDQHVGTIVCPTDGVIPVLEVGVSVMSFANWWIVELYQENSSERV